jgi:hypothetical protein
MRITIQPEGWAIIDQTVKMSLGMGINTVSIACPRSVDESSVLIEMIEAAEGVDVLSHEFIYGPPEGREDLYERLVGREVNFRLESGLTTSGKLLWSNPVTLQTPEGVLVAPKGDLLMREEDPDEILRTQPHLELIVQSTFPSDIICRISYAAFGFRWSSTQVCLLSESDQAVDFHCWLGLSNHSGMSFRNAEVSVVADSAGPQQISYRLGQKLDLWRDGSNLRVNLISAEGCGSSVLMTVPPRKEELWQTVVVPNSESNGLGLPFPPSDFVLLMRKPDGSTNYLSHGEIPAMYPNAMLHYDFARMLNTVMVSRTQSDTGTVTLGLQSLVDGPIQVFAREELRGNEIILNASKPPTVNGPTSLVFPMYLMPRSRDGVNYYLRSEDTPPPA